MTTKGSEIMRTSGGVSWTWLRAVVATVLVGSALVLNPGGAASETETADDATTELDAELAFAQQILEVAQNPDVEPSQRAIDTARMALDHRRGQVDAELLPLLDQQARNLATAEELLALGEPDEENALEYGIAAAKVATGHQAGTLGLDVESVEIEAPESDSPSEAALALVDHAGGQVTGSQLAELQTLDTLPEPAQVALTDFIDAFIGFSIATDRAYADADMERIEALLDVMDDPEAVLDLVDSVQPRELLPDLGIDFTPVFAARNDLLDTVAPLRDALLDPEVQQQQPAAAPIQVAPVFSIELGLSTANTYSQDFLLLIDVGGDDTYLNNAGGALVIARSAAALFDLLGNDQYRSGRSSGINGGGSIASGLLIDALGNDQYTAGGSGTNGGGNIGTGLLLDALGTDTYSASDNATNGGAQIGGVGLLIDSVGGDSYTAGSKGSNGGGYFGGIGSHLDTLGADVRTGSGQGTNGGGNGFGIGFLIDSGLEGDSYTAGSHGVNGGGGNRVAPDDLGFGGAGFLLDIGGSDSYSGGARGVNGGAALGTGVLLDGTGNDTYSATSISSNGAALLGVGILVDSTGSDAYTVADGSGNGMAAGGSGNLIDGSGNDRYTGGNGEGFAATALLADGGGTDRYRPNTSSSFVFDQTVVPKGLVGAQIDAPTVPVPPTTLPTLPPTTLPVSTTVPDLPPTTLPPLPTTTTSVPLPTTTVPTVTTTSVPLPSTTVPTVTTTSVPLPPVSHPVVVAGDARVEPDDLTFTITAPTASATISGTFSTSKPSNPLGLLDPVLASPGVDYTAVVDEPVTLDATNGFTATVTVTVADDTEVELPELLAGTFTVTGGPGDGTAATSMAVIVPDGDQPSTNTPPNPPTLIEPADGSSHPLGEPEDFVVNATDPDLDPYTATITVRDASTGAVVDTFETLPAPSGTNTRGSPNDLLPVGSYTWSATATDIKGATSGPSDTFSFSVS